MNKTVFLIVASLTLIGTSGLAYASDNSADLKAVINKNPIVANYVHELLDSIKTLDGENTDLQEKINQQNITIVNLTESNAEKQTTITSLTSTNEQLHNAIANLTEINKDLNSQIQLIDLTVGIIEGSTFGDLKRYLVNKEVTFANDNGRKWRVTTDGDGIARISLPAGKYNISVPGYKSYDFKFIPEESKFGYVYTDAASYSFGNSTSTSFWFYDENNLPPLPSYP